MVTMRLEHLVELLQERDDERRGELAVALAERDHARARLAGATIYDPVRDRDRGTIAANTALNVDAERANHAKRMGMLEHWKQQLASADEEQRVLAARTDHKLSLYPLHPQSKQPPGPAGKPPEHRPASDSRSSTPPRRTSDSRRGSNSSGHAVNTGHASS